MLLRRFIFVHLYSQYAACAEAARLLHSIWWASGVESSSHFLDGWKILSTYCLQKLFFLWKSRDRSRLGVHHTTIHQMKGIIDWWGWQWIIIFAWNWNAQFCHRNANHMCIWPFTETLDLSLLNLVAGMATYGTVRVVQAHGLAFGTNSLCLQPIHGRVIAVQVQWNPHLRETLQLRWQNTALKSGGAPNEKVKTRFWATYC